MKSRRLLLVLGLLWFATACSYFQERRLVRELRGYGLKAERTERGVVVYLPDVLFDFDSANLTDQAATKVDFVASVARRVTPDRTLAVEGHTDSLGRASYNLGLSERRADAVRNQILRSGYQAEQTRAAGYGEAYPIAPNRRPDQTDDPEGRSQNRRVEIVIERAGGSAKAPAPPSAVEIEEPDAQPAP